MNRVVEYLIRAKDATMAGVQSATTKLKKFVTQTKAQLDSIGKSEGVNKATSTLADLSGSAKRVLPNLMAVSGAMGMMDGASAKVARAISGIAGMTMMLGPVGAAIGALQVAIGLFAESAQKKIEALQRKTAEMAEYVARQMARVKEEVLTEVREGFEAVATAVDKATKAFERHAQVRARLAAASNSSKASADDLGLTMMERTRDRELGKLNGNERELAAAEWGVKMARERERVEATRNRRAADESRTLVAEAEKRVRLSEKNVDKLEDALQKLRREYKERDLDGLEKRDRDGKWTDFIKDFRAQIKEAEKRVATANEKLLADNEDLNIAKAEAEAGAKAREVANAKAVNATLAAEIEAERTVARVKEDLDKQAEDERLKRLKEIEDENKRIAAEEKRAADELARIEAKRHAQALRAANEELRVAEKEQSVASSRLDAAKQSVSQAWGWYRNRDQMQAQIDEFKAQREAEAQWEKDFARLKDRRRDWRDVEFGKLSADEEAVRQVAFAKEEEQAAQRALDEIAENTAHLKAIAEALATEEGE